MCYFFWSYFSLFAHEILKNAVFLAAVFFLFLFSIRRNNPGCTEHWASVLNFLNDCAGDWEGTAPSCSASLFTSVIGHSGPSVSAPNHYQGGPDNISPLLWLILPYKALCSPSFSTCPFSVCFPHKARMVFFFFFFVKYESDPVTPLLKALHSFPAYWE